MTLNIQFDSVSNVFDPASTDFTASIWVNPTNYNTNRTCLAQLNGTGTGRAWIDIIATTGRVQTVLSGTSQSFTSIVSTNVMTYLVISKTGTTIRLYVDGKLDPTTITATTEAASGVSRIGASKGSSNFFLGTFDEVRISNTARSADWIKTEYNNQNSPSTFYVLGGLEAKTPANPGLKIKGGVKFR